MGGLKLYMVPLAPNPTKVMLYLAEREAAGQPLPVEQVVVNTLKGKHREAEHLARNPFGTLPVLQLEDGRFLRESRSIIDYLDERFADGALQTGAIADRAMARDLERSVELRIANPLGAYVHYVRSPLGLPANPERAAEIEREIAGPLDFLEQALADGRPWLAGDRVSIADLTLQAALQFVRFAEVDILGDRPALRRWDEHYRARPAAQAVLRW